VEVQRGMATRNAEVPQDKRIEFRIGIHQGDVVIEGRLRKSPCRIRGYGRAAA
jgi:class 3 adenylate cyclase